MQMFVLDRNPRKSADYLADVHVRVICREISMCLSSWYAKNIGHTEELPYRAFNHPIVEQMNNPNTRSWVILNAWSIFLEFQRRFNKVHASKEKFLMLYKYIKKHDAEVTNHKNLKFMNKATFSFVEKDRGVIKNLPTNEAVERYREYYKNKLNTMKVPVTYTETYRPEWSK